MFAIETKDTVEHPEEVAARERLRDVVCGPLVAAWSAWFAIVERLGRAEGNDAYNDEVSSLVFDLEERLICGRSDRQDQLTSAVEGQIVPLFDSDGNPVMRNGQQMYSIPDHAKRIEAAVVALAQWLDHTPERTAVECLLRGADYLRGDQHNPELLPDEVDYVVREAAKIRRGRQP